MYRLAFTFVFMLLSTSTYCLNLNIPAESVGGESASENMRRVALDNNYRPNVIKKIDKCVANEKPVVMVNQSYVYTLDIQSDGVLQSVNYQEKDNEIARKVAGILFGCGPFGRFPGVAMFGAEVYSIKHEVFLSKRKGPGVRVRVKYNN
ncbi:hypothetical protein A9Q99_14195 [Gammaproteobacteria bacterium 45_16_T64]|nr:hypothetical protein A9Q99_14195 [Gammaproteobacteria bacterium 45_16_T64]